MMDGEFKSNNMNKETLQDSGWTIDECLKRMSGCLAGIREARERAKQSETAARSLFTYRYLFVAEYERNKRKLAILRG